MKSGPYFFKQVVQLLVVLGTGIIASWLITWLFLWVKTDFNLSQTAVLADEMMYHTPLLRLNQLVQSLCLFLLPPFLMSKLAGVPSRNYLFIKKPTAAQLLVAIGSLIAAIPLINVLVAWNQQLHLPAFMGSVEAWMRSSEESAAVLTERMLAGTSWKDLVASLFIVALVAGTGEEFFFRGLLKRILITGWTKQPENGSLASYPKGVIHAVIWMVAFLFSAIHLQFFGFFPRLLLGAWFGYLLWWTGSIWVPVAAHITNNALSTLAVFATQHGWIGSDPDQWGLQESWWLNLLAIGCLVASVRFFSRQTAYDQ
jgi:membrane protease YdiL (CAAX protease family)